MRSTLEMPLETLEDNLENIIKKGKTSQEGISATISCDSCNLHDYSFKTPIVVSSSPFIPSFVISISLDFGIFLVEIPPSSVHLEGESFENLVSPDIVKWFRPRSLEDFPILGFPAPLPIEVVVSKEGETYFPLNPITFSSNNQLFPFSHRNKTAVLPIQTPSPPCSPTIRIPMAGANIPINRMDAIVATRYAPLVLPLPMNALPVGDYLKHIPKLTGEEDITIIARFASPLLSCTEGLFPFPYAYLSSLFDESRAKNIHFSTYTLPISYTRCIYACCSTTTCVYRDLCQKIQNKVEFPCHDRRYLILGLPYTRNVLTRPFSCILKAIRTQFQAMEKEEKTFNFERKVTLEKLLHIEFASLCPSSLNTVFSPQDLSLLLRGPHFLFPMNFPLVED
jgi:hypothetical protein